MLGKLIKHEFKATYMNFILLYMGVIVLTIINKVFWLVNSESVVLNVIRGFVTALYVISIIAVCVVTLILIIYRFYKNLLKDEGYLSFTLPVRVSEHVISKLLVSFVWQILTLVVIVLSFLIMGMDTGMFNMFAELRDALSFLITTYDGVVRLAIEFIILIIVAFITSILMLYAALSLGQLFAKHKLGGAILSYIGFYFIMQIVNTLILSAVMVGNTTVMRLAINNEDLPVNLGIEIFNKLFLWIIIIQVITSLIYYFITYIMLKKKLNLE